MNDKIKSVKTLEKKNRYKKMLPQPIAQNITNTLTGIIVSILTIIGLALVLISPNGITTNGKNSNNLANNQTREFVASVDGNNNNTNIFRNPPQPEPSPSEEPTTIITLRDFVYDSGTIGSSIDARVNQGDPIFIPEEVRKPGEPVNGSKCTVGFVDHRHSRIWFAGHCIQSAIDNNVKPVVYIPNTGIELGDAHRFGSDGNTDIAYAEINPQRIGENIYTGNDVMPVSEIPTPDVAQNLSLCIYSRRTNKSPCAVMDNFRIAKTVSSDKNPVSVGNTAILRGMGISNGEVSLHGDSGGPAWILDEKGYRHFVGIISSVPLRFQYRSGYGFYIVPLAPWLNMTAKTINDDYPDLADESRCNKWVYNSGCDNILNNLI